MMGIQLCRFEVDGDMQVSLSDLHSSSNIRRLSFVPDRQRGFVASDICFCGSVLPITPGSPLRDLILGRRLRLFSYHLPRFQVPPAVSRPLRCQLRGQKAKPFAWPAFPILTSPPKKPPKCPRS